MLSLANRDREGLAHDAAIFLKTKMPHAEITVRDLQTGMETANPAGR
jgi:hypothetical protein